jgi:sarcosine oxidase subunit alpha
VRRTEIAVVGGGPAGLSAAVATAGAGAQTVLLDENPTLGGQLRYRVAEVAPDGRGGTLRAPALLARLTEEVAAAGVDARPGSLAWGLFEDNVLTVVDATDSYQLRAERIVLATGSTDLPYPFAGGSLPGVFSARAVQILLHLHRVLPGRRFVVLGGGPAAAELAEDIRLAGGEVVATFDPRDDASSVRAEGQDGVRSVTLNGQRYDAEIVIVALDRQPDPALALMAECAAGYAAELGGYVPVRDDRLQTSDPRILVAGDAAGLCDVPTALAEGRLTGLSAALALAHGDEAVLDAARQALDLATLDRLNIGRGMAATYVQG